MAFLSAGVSLGSILGAAGTIFSGVMAISQGNYQKAVAEMNASIAEGNAKRATERASLEARDNDTLTAGMLGQQEAAQSASGISLTSKSPTLTRAAARRLGRRDTLNIIHAGQIEAYNYKTEAVNQRSAGKAAQMEGRAGLIGSFLGAGGTLLGGAKPTRGYARITGDNWITKKGTNLRYGG